MHGTSSPTAGFEFLEGGGETGALMRAYAWADSPIGGPDLWPQPLKTLVAVTLGSEQPMFITWGPERTLLYNDGYAAMLGGKHPAALGRSLLDVWSEIRNDLQPLVDQIDAGESVHMDDITLIIERYGIPEEAHFAFSYTPVRDETGRIAGIFCPCQEITRQVLAERAKARDITVLRQAEAALREREARLRLVIEGARDHAIFTTDPNGRITSWSAGAAAIFGWSAEEILGKSTAILFTPEDRAAGADQHELATAKDYSCADNKRWHVRKDGSRVFMNGSIHPLPVDGEGREQGFLKIAHDETDRQSVETALRESEARARELAAQQAATLGQLAEGVIVTDAEGRITLVNEAAARIHGVVRLDVGPGEYSETYSLFTEGGDPFPSDDLPLARAVRGKTVLDARWRIRQPGGAEVVAVGNARPVLDGAGRQIGAVLTLRDDTARLAAEAALRLRGEEFYALADNIPSLCWIAYADGHIFWYNRRWYEYTGASRDSQEGWGWASVHDPDLLPTIVARWKHSIETGEPFEMVFPLKRADGVFRPFLTRIVPIRDDAGAIVRWFGTNVDITEQRETEVRLEQSVEARTRERDQLWDLSEDLLAVANYEGQLIRVSPSWTRHFGYGEQTLLSRPYGEIIHPDDLPATMDALLTMRTSGRPVSFENRVLASHGAWRWVAWTVSPEPGGERLIAVGRDIMGQKEAAEALKRTEEQLRQAQKMEAVGQLTGGIAHDFNNLLTGVIGSLEMMQRRMGQGRPDDIERYAKAAMTSANRAAALTHRLLAFSRRQPLDPKPVNANRLVTGMEELLRRTIGEALRLEIVTAGGLWQTICDPHQLESAILNLAINARDAMPEGGTLTIETCNAHLDNAYVAQERDVRPGQYVCICVTDTGTGMSADTIARAFEPFFTTKPIGQGTGLGLSMIYGFARQSEGYAKIYSELGQGTTVKLYLPRYYGESDGTEAASPALSETHRAEHGEVVLVVEDETAVRNLVVDVLQDLGYRAIEAADGLSGLKLLQSDMRVDLLVTDVGLPGLNGRQLADAARMRRPDLKVLFMTGYAENATIANGFLEPRMQMITKPFAIEALATRIRDMIEGNGS